MPVRCKRLHVVCILREFDTVHSQEWLCYCSLRAVMVICTTSVVMLAG
jgi:hypothetical protein